jgi:RNA polymerase sigma-70 factor (ECF subfamily)
MSLADAEDRGPAEEARLVAQIAAGDVEAPMTELYRRYSRRLYRFGIQVLGDTGLSEEMVQESFLFVIARSTAADIRKRPSSRPLLPVEEADAPRQADSVDQIIDGLIVHEALGTLSLAHREVLHLAQDEGLTQSQIAERLGLPLGTVKTRMFHAMRTLRAALAERGIHGA